MPPDLFVDRVLDDEGLIGELDEAEASLLIASVVERVRDICEKTNDARLVGSEVEKLCKRARRVAAAVAAFRDKGEAEGRKMTSIEGWSWPFGVSTPSDLIRGLMYQLH